MATWQDYWKFLVEWEGSDFENDPNDSGNRGDGSAFNYGTKFGVDAASHPGVDIVHLTSQQASDIYQHQFLTGPFAALPEPIGYVCFDFGMNAGTAHAVQCVQSVTGAHVDGAWGPKTQAAFDSYNALNGNTTIPALIACRRSYYRSISGGHLAEYLKGWLNRCDALETWANDNQ